MEGVGAIYIPGGATIGKIKKPANLPVMVGRFILRLFNNRLFVNNLLTINIMNR